MAIIPKQVCFTPKQEFDTIQQELRPYLGMSQLGHDCTRYLWYAFRWAYIPSYTRKQLRIFERGNIEESRVIADLMSWGYDVVAAQKEYVAGFGHIKGHVDALAFMNNETVVLEIKTMASKYFAEVVKHGLRKAHPMYFAQAQLYLGQEGLNTAVFIICNKDTEDRKYIDIPYIEGLSDKLIEKGISVIFADNPPRKISDTPSWHKCKFCPAQDICHYNVPLNKSCRLCEFIQIQKGGKWFCSLHSKELDEHAQRTACDKFEEIPT